VTSPFQTDILLSVYSQLSGTLAYIGQLPTSGPGLLPPIITFRAVRACRGYGPRGGVCPQFRVSLVPHRLFHTQLDYIGQLPTCGPGLLPAIITFAFATFVQGYVAQDHHRALGIVLL